jgi:uridine monophosphate synthetase
MEQKCSNLSVAADVTTCKALLELANTLGPNICVLKTHIDILSDFTHEIIPKLQQAAEKHNFLIFEDRKFADIGNTALHQYEGGIYKINEWAHLTNAHPLPGPGLIEGLQKVGQPKGNGLLLLAQLSSKGNFIDEGYTKKTVELALRYPEFVLGFICQERLTDHPSYIHMTPGVQFGAKGDALGQHYNTPEYAINERGSDIIIVGRGITEHASPKESARAYQEAGWSAYQNKLTA